uniref:phosphoribosylanthranilate isomerase n=1 Tax=Pararhizobium sp. IMCC3301 TaxID=3067904 RepID=UPI0027409110|nr:phosphoribosylanthranilate isomerase [Pararhizobium sp. IMCC3301]
MTTEPAFDIKICGLSTQADIAAAMAGGASMVGLVFFAKSPRNVSLAQAEKLAASARQNSHRQVQIVALTVNPDDVELAAIVARVQPDIVQLHGTEPASRVAEIKLTHGVEVMKAFGVREVADFDGLKPYASVADRLLIDAKPPQNSVLPGGNGLTFDWSILDALTARICGGLPVMLSGGLNPDNVASAVELSQRHPVISGIDVSSGVETSPGIKDKGLIETFLQRAKAAAPSTSSRKEYLHDPAS